MEKREIAFVAKSAALQVISSMRDTVEGLVANRLEGMVTNALAVREPVAEANQRRWQRVYCEKPAPPANNFTQFIMERAKWQAGKGIQVAIVWLFKPDSPLKLMVEQYGEESPECAILQMDRSQPKSKLGAGGNVVCLGKSPWVDFKVTKGNIGHVVEILKEKGWFVQPVETRQVVQLKLAGAS